MSVMETFGENIVFVKKISTGIIYEQKDFLSQYADLNYLIQNKILTSIDANNIEIHRKEIIIEELSFKKENISISGEPNRLTFKKKDSTKSASISDFIKPFLSHLANENISAIGVNFEAIIEEAKADAIFQEKILKKSQIPLISTAEKGAFKIVHSHNNEKYSLKISIDIGTGGYIQEKITKNGFLISFNFHHEISDLSIFEENNFLNIIQEVKNLLNDYKLKIESIFNE